MKSLRLLVCTLAVTGCFHAEHHVRVMDLRRSPRIGPCDHPLVTMDHGPDRPHNAIAIVTAECATSKEDECRHELEVGACQADADALIDVSRQRTSDDHLRMVGTAVEYLSGGH